MAAAGPEDVDAAVAAARAALDGPWGKMSARERGRLVWKIGERLMERADEIARLETLHNGKPIFESRQIEIPAAAECFQYYAGWADKIHGETIPVEGQLPHLHAARAGRRRRRDRAVELSAAADVVEGRAGAGVRQHRDHQAGEPDAADRARARRDRDRGRPAARRAQRHHRAAATTVGQMLVDASRHRQDRVHRRHVDRQGRSCAASADTLKRITLELGGKSPNIVFADADLDAAVRGATTGIFYGKGEVCAAGSRLLVDRSIKDEFIDKVAARAKKMLPGDPLDPKTRLGAIASKKQLETDLRYVETAKKEGATLVAGGERADIGTGKGYFLQPTVFDGVTPAHDHRARGDLRAGAGDDRVRRRRRSDRARQRLAYGLAAAVWTRDIKKAHHVARQLQAGTVWINTYNVYDTAAPFGGYKQSGFGREMARTRSSTTRR